MIYLWFPIVCMLFHDYMSVASVGKSFVMGYGQYGISLFCLPAEERKYFFRNRSRKRKSAHRQWSVACQSLRRRLSSSVGVGLRIFRLPVCNITPAPDPNPRNMQISGFQKGGVTGLPKPKGNCTMSFTHSSGNASSCGIHAVCLRTTSTFSLSSRMPFKTMRPSFNGVNPSMAFSGDDPHPEGPEILAISPLSNCGLKPEKRVYRCRRRHGIFYLQQLFL